MSIITGSASSISEKPAYVEQLSYFCLAKEHVPIAGISIGEANTSAAALGQMWEKHLVIKHKCKIFFNVLNSLSSVFFFLIFISPSVSVEGILKYKSTFGKVAGIVFSPRPAWLPSAGVLNLLNSVFK